MNVRKIQVDSDYDILISNCREQIIDMVNRIEDEKVLQFIFNLLISFEKKWGI